MACTKETDRCAVATSYHHDLPECCRSHVREIMRTVGELLQRAGIPYWLDYGSALGVAQNPLFGEEPGIVPHDKDGDCGILGADQERFLALKPAIEAAGLHFIHKPFIKRRRPTPWSGGDSFKVRWSKQNHTNVDFFLWYEREDGTMYRRRYIAADRYKGREFPKEMLFPLRTVTWEGMALPFPAAAAEEWAEMRYGPRWQERITANHHDVMMK